MTFSEKALQYVQAHSRVLDLGAGKGWFAKEALARGAIVTAVDRQAPVETHQDIDWRTVDVRDFVQQIQASEMFDCIYTRNLIQFLDSEWVEQKLLPTLESHLNPQGILAIQTFYQDPEPRFDSALTSVYPLATLKSLLGDLNVVHERQFSETSPDMNGVTRKFYVTNLIVQKKLLTT